MKHDEETHLLNFFTEKNFLTSDDGNGTEEVALQMILWTVLLTKTNIIAVSLNTVSDAQSED